MNKEAGRGLTLSLVFFLFGIVFLSCGVVAESEKSVFEANVLAPIVKVEIPTRVFLGNVTPGFDGERVKVEVENVGTTAVTITPQLEAGSEDVFGGLMFARRTTEPWQKIGQFSLKLDRPSSPGKTEKDYFYTKIDLSSYRGEIKQDKLGAKANVIFWVLPQ